MWLFMASVFCAGALSLAWYYWKPFFETEHFYKRSEFIGWMAKGLGLPVLAWVLINCGVLWSFGPFMPKVSQRKAAGLPWEELLLYYIGTGTIVLASLWLAASLLWLLIIVFRSLAKERRSEFKTYAAFWSVVTYPVAGVIVWLGEWYAKPVGLCVWLIPVAHWTTPLLTREKEFLSYSGALGRMKLGKFKEAEASILQQLEKCEDDYDGWMMLAELYAKHFGDVDTADQTVRELCAQPGLNPGQIYTALNRLADWHLTLADDPVAARDVLNIVCEAYPQTHLARLAHTRMSQLPASRKELLAQREGRRIRLPALRENLDSAAPPPSLEAPAAANDCVNRLKANPDDVPTREKLARLFAEQLGRANLGIEQLELLIEMPGQPENKIAEWLAEIAAWQFKYLKNPEAGRRILERLVSDHPQTPQAFAAQRRLLLMDAEQRFRRRGSDAEPRV